MNSTQQAGADAGDGYVSIQAVPEPTNFAAPGLGIARLGVVYLRRRVKA